MHMRRFKLKPEKSCKKIIKLLGDKIGVHKSSAHLVKVNSLFSQIRKSVAYHCIKKK